MSAAVHRSRLRSEVHVTPCRYEIPAGFEGWVTIRFDAGDSPPLPIVDGWRVLRIPWNGYLATSSRQELGVIDLHFFYVSAGGAAQPIEDLAKRRDADSFDFAATYGAPVILGFRTGDVSADGMRRVYEGFYVGRGPAGEPPDWP